MARMQEKRNAHRVLWGNCLGERSLSRRIILNVMIRKEDGWLWMGGCGWVAVDGWLWMDSSGSG